MAKTYRIVVQQGEAIELTSGWTELYQAGEAAIFLMPVRIKRIGGYGRHYLLPVGEPVGGLAVEVTLTRIEERKARR